MQTTHLGRRPLQKREYLWDRFGEVVEWIEGRVIDREWREL